MRLCNGYGALPYRHRLAEGLALLPARCLDDLGVKIFVLPFSSVLGKPH